MDICAIKNNHTRYKHLIIDEDNHSAILLGYELNLTKTEYKILSSLVHCGASPLSAEQLASSCEAELSKNNVAFHIYNINLKAKAISGRILVKNIAKTGYFLNEKM